MQNRLSISPARIYKLMQFNSVEMFTTIGFMYVQKWNKVGKSPFMHTIYLLLLISNLFSCCYLKVIFNGWCALCFRCRYIRKSRKTTQKSIKKNKNLQVKTIYRFLFLNQRVKYTFQQLTIKKNCIARYTWEYFPSKAAIFPTIES